MIICQLRRRLLRDTNGQALVETALVIPLLLLLLLGVFEFGRLFNAYMTVQHAAREGARLGVLGATDAEIIAQVQANAVTLSADQLTVAVSPGEGSRATGTILTVTVDYSFEVVIPLISEFLGAGIPIRSALSMRVE